MEGLTVGTPNNYCTRNSYCNIVTQLEFRKIREGIRRLTDTSTLRLFYQSQFVGEGKFAA